MRRRGPGPFVRIGVALAFAALVYGAWRASRWALGTVTGQPAPPAVPANLQEVFGPFQLMHLVGDLNGDGRSDVVAVSPNRDGERRIALLLVDGDRYRLAGEPQRLLWPEALPALSRADLPGAPGSLVATVRLPGGEEQYQAFAPSAERGLMPLDYYRLVAPDRSDRNLVLVDKRLNVLYYYRNGKVLFVARAATGKDRQGPPSAKNRFTPEGRFRVAVLQANPSYTSPDGKKSWAGGAPDNPLGTRWMGFPVLKGDTGWIFGIQGTNEPAKLGTWSSDGSIWLANADAEKLFELVGEGTPVEIR